MLIRRYRKETQKKTVEKTVQTESKLIEAFIFEELTVKELKDMAKEKGLEGYSNMKKEELIEFLKGAE